MLRHATFENLVLNRDRIYLSSKFRTATIFILMSLLIVGD
jgi:hypothetical protein